MKINILHLTGNRRESITEFSKQNPHAKVNMATGKVETLSLVHYFRQISSVEDARLLAGINFSSIMVWGMPPKKEVSEYLWSRLREPKPATASLKLSVRE